MQPDPATDSTGRMNAFLDKAITGLKGSKPMESWNTTVQPMANQANEYLNGPLSDSAFGKTNDLVASLTGASSLADALLLRIEKSKARHIAAGAKVDAAFGKLDGASEVLEAVATKVEAEADAVLAKLGQVSNMG
jgi:hypothetical protein